MLNPRPGSWIGPADFVCKALELQLAQVVDGQFRIEGPAIEYMLRNDTDDNDWNIVEVKPDTVCFIAGRPTPIIELLAAFLTAFQMACRVTVGLPIATRKR